MTQYRFSGTGTGRRLFPARHIRRTELDLIYTKGYSEENVLLRRRYICVCAECPWIWKSKLELKFVFILYTFYKEFPGKLRTLHATVLNSSYKTLSKDIPSCRRLSLRTITAKQNNLFIAKTFSCDIIMLDVSTIIDEERRTSSANFWKENI